MFDDISKPRHPLGLFYLQIFFYKKCKYIYKNIIFVSSNNLKLYKMDENSTTQKRQLSPKKLQDLQDDAPKLFSALKKVFSAYNYRVHLSTHNYDEIKSLIQKHETNE